MPRRDPEKKKEHNKKYYEKNEKQVKQYKKQWYELNKEKVLEKSKGYYYKNRGKILDERKTPEGVKRSRINAWRNTPKNGLPLLCVDYDEIYDYYINTEYCENEECKVRLTEDKILTPTTRCMDHCHKTGEFRFILCHKCNGSMKYRQY